MKTNKYLLSFVNAIIFCLITGPGQMLSLANGLKLSEIPFVEYGQPIMRQDFERCMPSHLIRIREEISGKEKLLGNDLPADSRGTWLIRQLYANKPLLNVRGTPPDIIYEPNLKGPYDIYLGLRAVTPNMSLGIKLAGEKDFTIVSSPAASEKKHFDFEYHWKIDTEMEGQKIVLHSVGRPIYLHYIKFVPILKGTRQMRTVSEHVTIIKSPGQHFAFPGVAKLPNGEIAVVCRQGKEHVDPFGRIILIRSKDGGRKWSEPSIVYDSPSDDRDPAIVTLPDNRVLLTCYTWNSWMTSPQLINRYALQTAALEKEGINKYHGSKIMFSENNGETWSEPLKIAVFSPHGPIVGPDNALYYPGITPLENGCQAITIWRSADKGRTWSPHGNVVTSASPGMEKGQIVYDEPNLAIMQDRKWLVTLRVDSDGFGRLSFREDNCDYWSQANRLKVRGYPQHLLPLKDGRLLMTYGYRFFPMGIRACVSSDGGKTWDLENEIILRYEGGHEDLGYPVSIQLDDGTVFSVYYYNHKGGDCYIEGAFYRP